LDEKFEMWRYNTQLSRKVFESAGFLKTARKLDDLGFVSVNLQILTVKNFLKIKFFNLSFFFPFE